MWYDEIEGIQESLTTLKGFHALLQARAEAFCDRGETLRDFLVIGRYWLDQSGGLWICDGAAGQGQAEERLLVIPCRPDGYSATKSGVLPRPASTCKVCGKAWQVTDLHDVISVSADEDMLLDTYAGRTLRDVRDDLRLRTDAYVVVTLLKRGGREIEHLPDDLVLHAGDVACVVEWRFYHAGCHQAELSARQETSFKQMFASAGFGDVSLVAVKNLYGSASYRGPWFECRTGAGVVLVGWRKRVINIDWSATGLDLSERFCDVTDTKGPYFIHAWTIEQAVDYLGRIREALQHADA